MLLFLCCFTACDRTSVGRPTEVATLEVDQSPEAQARRAALREKAARDLVPGRIQVGRKRLSSIWTHHFVCR